MLYKREIWLDLIKGIVIICVVFEHAYESVNNYMPWESIGLNVLSECIKTFQMALFFSVSGYLYREKEQAKMRKGNFKDIKRYIYIKFTDLLVPYTIFGCLIWIGKLLFSQWVKYQVGWKDLVMMYIKPISFAWFLYALFLYEVVLVFIDFFVKKNVITSIALSLLCLLIACGQVTSEANVDKVLYYGFFYVLGTLIAGKSWVNNKLQGLIGLLLYIIFFVLYYLNKSCVLLFAICGVLAVIIVFGFMGKVEFSHSGINRLIGFIGAQSLYIYIIHPIIQHGLRAIFVMLGYMEGIVWLIELTVAGVCIPLFYYVMSKKLQMLSLPFKPRHYFERMKEMEE